MMSPLLRGLRINCLLAAFVPALLALAWMIWAAWAEADRQADAAQREAVATVTSWSRLRAAGFPVAADQLLAGDPRWWTVAEVVFPDVERHEVRNTAGRPLPYSPDDLPDGVVRAILNPEAWNEPGAVCAAAGLVDATSGAVRSVLVLRGPLPSDAAMRLLVAIPALLVLAGLVAWYLARRIYDPIRHLQEAASAALDGRTVTPGPTSAETSAVESSVTDLIASFRVASSRIEVGVRKGEDAHG